MRGMSGCLHCGNQVPTGSRHAPYCCAGCREVYALIHGEGLGRFYDLGGRDGVPVQTGADRPRAWLEPLVSDAETRSEGLCRLELDVQGVHCAGCVWLMNELFSRQEGGASLTVNPSLGKVQVLWRKGAFNVDGFLAAVERFGYRFGPSRKEKQAGSRDLPLRIGISVALTMNVMIFTASFYTGLGPDDPEIFDLFGKLSMGLSTGVVLIGGWPFFKAAIEALRRRVLHLDLPIAAGILLAYGTSLVQANGGRADLGYWDTLCTFTTLMLVGRWLQERLLHRNRRFLLDDAGAEGLHVRVRDADRVQVVTAPQLKAGDLLVIAPGDLVPVDAVLEDEAGLFSTDWINGESKPRRVAVGEVAPAGSFNAGTQAREARARTAFDASPLPALLRTVRDAGTSPRSRIIGTVSRYYVPVVLLLAFAGFFSRFRFGLGETIYPALDVTVALLVVTCPCALGIALPLATELALARLRRSGVFVRAGDLVERALTVRHVMFDKTGTLTLGTLEVEDESVLDKLDDEARRALHAMAGRSNHPVSRAVAEALRRRLVPFDDARIDEIPGEGLQWVRDGRVWRFGRPSWALESCGESSRDAAPHGTTLAVDGKALAQIVTREAIRVDARSEVQKLEALGVRVWLVSGDDETRAQAVARELGVDPSRAVGGCRPEDKAKLVADVDRGDTLFVGDGVNDALAFERAACTGTPAVDRPVMPARSDFFLMGEGVSGVRALLEDAHRLRRTVWIVLGIAMTYNVLAVAASFAGLMTPLRAAIAMPLSSVSLILLVAWLARDTMPQRKAHVVRATLETEGA